MEATRKLSGYGGILKQEKRVESDANEEGCKEEMVPKGGSGHRDHDNDNMKSLSTPNQKELCSFNKQDDQLESAKVEMSKVIEENQKLRMYLDQIMKDYRTLQLQFHEIIQQEQAKESTSTSSTHQEMEDTELISLTLGRTSSDPKRDENRVSIKDEVNEQQKESLLRLDCKYEGPKIAPAESSPNGSSENSIEEAKEDARDTWTPQKVQKTVRSREDDVSEQTLAKKARVSVRVRCNTPTMNDGCQWRKYGQKIAKGNPCPRAYYRCTVAPDCPVRKQVQRCAEDMSILISTYEGTHNHPLPHSATAMASTTSAAASMLLSGSSTSMSRPGQSITTTAAAADLQGLNFYLSDNSKSRQFYLPNSSISSSLSHPTITLDLTSNPSSSSHLNRIPPNFPSRYSSTKWNFNSLESNHLPFPWSNGVLGYGTQQPYNNNQFGSLSFGKQPQENPYLPYMQKNNIPPTQQPLPPDTIAAATKALTSDPSFRSALAAALTSIIGSGNGSTGAHVGGEKSGQSLNLGESFPFASNLPSTSHANTFSSTYINKSTPAKNSETGKSMFLPPNSNSFPFSTSKSKSTPPAE